MNSIIKDQREAETPEIKFYWYREETEIYAARSVDEFRETLQHEGHDPWPNITEETKGDEWGDANPGMLVHIEDEGDKTLAQLIKDGQHPPLPAQISTAYA